MTNKQKIDIIALCRDAGMSPEEFKEEIRRAYASIISIDFDDNPDAIKDEYQATFLDHKIVISARRIPVDDDRTLN